MKHWFWLLWLLPALALSLPGDDKVLAAREAFRNGERVKLGKHFDSLRGQAGQHDLQPWVEYWYLLQHLEESSGDDVKEFLARPNLSGSYLAEKLRGDWLKLLGKRHQWETFQREYPALQQPDQELACYAVAGRLAVQQDPAALEEVRPLWFAATDLPDSCVTLLEQLIAAGRIDADDVWERLRRLFEAKKLKSARRRKPWPGMSWRAVSSCPRSSWPGRRVPRCASMTGTRWSGPSNGCRRPWLPSPTGATGWRAPWSSTTARTKPAACI
ncbi:MAG: hypothetical protein NTY41_13345 [Proteobacteria bacterium]|nr:hypothetical protein [Pseudomonadota bacterium]